MADHLWHPFRFSGAQGLGNHGAAGGGNSLADDADHVLQLSGNTGDRYGHSAIGIDIGIDEQHGEGDGRALDHHGNAQAHQLTDDVFVDPEMPGMKIEMDLLPVFVQEPQGKEEADRLADDRGQGGAQRTHAHGTDEQDVQDDVDDGSDRDKDEGML